MNKEEIIKTAIKEVLSDEFTDMREEIVKKLRLLISSTNPEERIERCADSIMSLIPGW